MDLAEKARKAKLLEDACEKNEVETIAEKEAAPSRESRAESLEGECKVPLLPSCASHSSSFLHYLPI